MKSKLAKPLHQLAGQPLTHFALNLAQSLGVAAPVFVVGHDADQVKASLPETAQFVLQAEQLGTGHAVQQAEPLLRGQSEMVLVWAVDMPLLTQDTLQRLVAMQRENPGPVTMLTVLADDPRGFGRVVRGADGNVEAIVEQAHATPEQLEINELNAGVYCFEADWLWRNLSKIPLSPKGEFYLTDLVEIARTQGRSVAAYTTPDRQEAIGINTRGHLAECHRALWQRINQHWMTEGVTIVDPAATYIGPSVTLASDAVILPNTHLEGETVIGADTVIGPNSIIRHSNIGAGCSVEASVVEYATMEDDVHIGPFAHLRKGAYLARGVHMGNFGEVKNSYLGPEVKMGHFSYIGDAEIGARTNIGAGTITCNFGIDKQKHKTVIGEDAYIGSDTMLVAPLEIGVRGRTGAGAVVTKDVPADALAVGVPAKVIKHFAPPDGAGEGDAGH